MLVLSLFPGIGLLDRGFESAGFCVVRGPDLLWGGDIRTFTPPPGRFDGVIGGPPCQDFSRARRDAPTGNGLAMLAEYQRVVEAARPGWWLMENVERVPDVVIPGYSHQRLDVWAHSFGMAQRRLRHIQFGSRTGDVLVLERGGSGGEEGTVMASDTSTPWDRFCALQGLPVGFDLPFMTNGAKRRAVGNGVPIPMAEALAQAVLARQPAHAVQVCACGCGRPITEAQTYARGSCRTRAWRRRHAAGEK